MGSFGETVASLLDTYTKCLSLLKGLRQDGRPSDSQSRLGTSIRSDRSKVRRVYSSKVSVKGRSFEKGDAAARSSLRRVIKKLTKTLERLMRTVTRSQRDPVDYESLMSLSSRSRLDAIRTMTDLSSRVGSTSSLRSTKSKSKRKSRSQDTGRSQEKNKKKKKGPRAAPGEHGRVSSGDNGRVSSKEQGRSPSIGDRGADARERERERGKEKRLSMMTMSSGSTKLGEIRRRGALDDSGAVYNARATYPLHSYSEQKTKEPKRWFGLFRN